MNQVRITDFNEHTKFKCVCMFVDELKNQKLIKSLFDKMKELLTGEDVERIFIEKHTTELKQKVIPMHVDFRVKKEDRISKTRVSM